MVRDVRVCIDQNMVCDSLVVSTDIETLSLDDIIRSKVLPAVRMVEMTAPVHLLENGHNFVDDDGKANDVIFWGKDCSGSVLLPDDFMRLTVFEMSDWERPVFEALSPSDSAYSLQRSSIVGVRGNWQRPVCAIVTRPEGKVLEFYRCKSEDATVSRAVYLPYPSIDKTGGVDLPERCHDSIVHMCAGLVLATYGKDEMGSTMMELSKSMMI